MEKKDMKLLGIEDILNDYETPEIESVEENVMKAVKSRRIKPARVQILLAPIIGYLVSSVLFAVFYSRNAVFSLVWDFIGDRIVSVIQGISKITAVAAAILPRVNAGYLYVPLVGMLIISVGALVMEKKNRKKGGNK